MEAAKHALTPEFFENGHGDPRSITERDAKEEDIDELIVRLKRMSVHDQAYAQTYSIAVRRMPSLKNLVRAPLPVNRAAPSQTHMSVNVASYRAGRNVDVPEPPKSCYYCGVNGCRMWMCTALVGPPCKKNQDRG
jgi:hypothetical protein